MNRGTKVGIDKRFEKKEPKQAASIFLAIFLENIVQLAKVLLQFRRNPMPIIMSAARKAFITIHPSTRKRQQTDFPTATADRILDEATSTMESICVPERF